MSIKLLLKANKPLGFDLFVQRTEDKFSKLLNRGDTIDVDRISSYANKGIKFFYVIEQDYELYSKFIVRMGEILREQAESLGPSEVLDVTKELVIYSVHELTTKLDIDDEVIESAATVVGECLAFIDNDKNLAFKLIRLLSSQSYLLKKSITTSILTVLLGKKLGINSKNNLEIVGLGGLLHDIGMSHLEFDPESLDIISREQRQEINRHPELGADILKTNKLIKREVILIVQQHHEQPNGFGFPNRLRDRDIFPPAKMVAITSNFVSLISDGRFESGISPEDALIAMEDAREKYDPTMLKQFRDLIKPSSAKNIKRASSFG